MINKVGIVVINYNNWSDTCELLKKLNQSQNLEFNLFLIDNASKNQAQITSDLTNLNLKYKLKLKINKHNLGFAKAVNQGLSYFYKNNYQYYLILNNDTLPPSNFLNCLIKEYTNLPGGSILSPLIKHSVKQQWLYGGEGFITKPIAIARHHNYRQLPKNLNKPKRVEFVSGCCMFFDKYLLDSGIWFDEKYFLYLEDVDLCLQAQQRGLFSYVTYNCIINHKQSRSFKKPTDKLKYSFVSNLKFAWKNYPLYIFIWLWFLPLFYTYLYLLWSKPVLGLKTKLLH